MVQGNIGRGDILDCDFGQYRILGQDAHGNDVYDRGAFDHRIPFEIRKLRPVVVIGDHKGQYLVVPISSTEDLANNPRKTGEGRGYHIVLVASDMPVTHRYLAGVKRWGKANMVQAVDRHRLSTIYCQAARRLVVHRMTDETLNKIRQGVMRSMGML